MSFDGGALQATDVSHSLEQQEQQLQLLQQQLDEQESLHQQQQQQLIVQHQMLHLLRGGEDSIPGDGQSIDKELTDDVLKEEPMDDQSTESNGLKRPASELAATDEEPVVKRRTTEIDKLWKNVTDNPNDFQAWTLLLQRIDQGDIEAGQDAYDSFLSRYPYCYGYWKKYADMEKRKGTQDSTLKVFNRGLEVIGLSVDLWCHYMDYVTTEYAGDEQFVRQEFDRSIEKCGLEFKSDKLWDTYINWESSGKRWKNVTLVYEQLLVLPLNKYLTHWQKFQDHVKKHHPSEVLGIDEYLELRKQVLGELNKSDTDTPDETPPGEESGAAGEHGSINADELKVIRKNILSTRQKLHEQGTTAAKLRWNYEDSIKRPYFHVKPLEKSQLSAWRVYLEFEAKQGDHKRIRVLFERCLIACAFYEEFWMRYVRYLEDHDGSEEELRIVYTKACTIHLGEKFRPHLSWAAFEEENGNQDQALEILRGVQKRVPGGLEAYMQAIGVERRRGNIENAETIFVSTLAMLKEREDKGSFAQMTIKFARFLTLFKNDPDASVECLESALADDKMNTGLILSLVDHMLACRPPKLVPAASLLKSSTDPNFPPATRLMFAHRFMHFNTECGQNSTSAGDGLRVLREVQHQVRQLEAARINEQQEENNENHNDKQLDSNNSSSNMDKKYTRQQPSPADKSNSYQSSSSGNNSGGNMNGAVSVTNTASQNYQQPYQNQSASGYGGYNQGGYPPQNYGGPPFQNWGYPSQQGSYGGYNQQGWSGYPNYYGQR